MTVAPIQGGVPISVQLHDVSSTGLAFKVNLAQAPELSTMVKVEFSAFQLGRLTCTGRVVRIEEPTERGQWKTFSRIAIVAVHFTDLDVHEKWVLGSEIRDKIRELNRLKREQIWRDRIQIIKEYRWQITLAILTILFVVFMLYILILPGGNYLPSMFIPWGTRSFDL